MMAKSSSPEYNFQGQFNQGDELLVLKGLYVNVWNDFKQISYEAICQKCNIDSNSNQHDWCYKIKKV